MTDSPTREPGDAVAGADEPPAGRYGLLERRLFPAIIAWTIHPLHILGLLLLWLMLLVVHQTQFELVGGNYTNGLSAMAASIVLLQQTRQHREIRRLHERHEHLLRRVHELVARRDADGTV